MQGGSAVYPGDELNGGGASEQHPAQHQESLDFLPESYEERRKLAERIDTQAEIWASMASTTHFPGMRNKRLADIIIRYCTPAEEPPEAFVARYRFVRKWNDRQAETHLHMEAARQTIATIVQHDAIEITPIKDPVLYETFEIAESYEQELQTSLTYPVALHLLKRLYTVREQLPEKIFVRNNTTSGHEFTTILRRLVEDL